MSELFELFSPFYTFYPRRCQGYELHLKIIALAYGGDQDSALHTMCRLIPRDFHFGHSGNDSFFERELPLISPCSSFADHAPRLIERLQELRLDPQFTSGSGAKEECIESLGAPTDQSCRDRGKYTRQTSAVPGEATRVSRRERVQKQEGGRRMELVVDAGTKVPGIEVGRKNRSRTNGTSQVHTSNNSFLTPPTNPGNLWSPSGARQQPIKEQPRSKQFQGRLDFYGQVLPRFRPRQYEAVGALHKTHTLCASGTCSNQAVVETDGRKGEFCRAHTCSARDEGCLGDVFRSNSNGAPDIGRLIADMSRRLLTDGSRAFVLREAYVFSSGLSTSICQERGILLKTPRATRRRGGLDETVKGS